MPIDSTLVGEKKIHPLGFGLVSFSIDDVKHHPFCDDSEPRHPPYLELEGVRRVDPRTGKEIIPRKDGVSGADIDEEDDPLPPVRLLVQHQVSSGDLTPFLTPLEARLRNDGSNGFNTSRLHEAPHVPNLLRCAIQHIDYLGSRLQIAAQFSTIRDALDRVVSARSDGYFLAFGEFCGARPVPKSKTLVPLLPPTSGMGDCNGMHMYPSRQYLVPMRFQPLALSNALRRLLVQDIVPQEITDDVKARLKGLLYEAAYVGVPSPVSSSLSIIRSQAERCLTVQTACLGQALLPFHEPTGSYTLVDHPSFKEGYLNVVVFPDDKF